MPNSLDFFNTHSEQQISEFYFGIVEDKPARISVNTNETWDAIVKNSSSLKLTFSPIDHILDLRREDGQKAKKIDAMLYILETLLILVELKAENNPYSFYTDANTQLKSTIDFMRTHNLQELERFAIKCAYIANRIRPTNHNIGISHINMFYKLTGFILKIEENVPNNVIDINRLLAPPI